MISFTKTPGEVALFGVNPQWVEVTTDGSDPDLVCELIVYVHDGTAYQEVTRLESPYTDQVATFNISKLIELGYDLPDVSSFDSFVVNEANQLIKRYKIEAEEYLADVQQGSTIDFERRAVNGRYETLEALDEIFYNEGPPQLLSKKPLNRKIRREQPDWIYLLTQDDVTATQLVIKIQLSDGTTENLIKNITLVAKYDVKIIPISFAALDLETYETGDVFVTGYTILIKQSYAVGDYGINMVINLDYDSTDWEQKTLLFQTSRGGMDTFVFKGKTESIFEREAALSRKVLSPDSNRYNHLTRSNYPTANYPEKLKSGHLQLTEMIWGKEFQFVKECWIIDQGEYVPISIINFNEKIIDDSDLLSFELDIQRESS